MKRLNPATNKPFKMGDAREDGFIFWGYDSVLRKDGYLGEQWRDPVKYAAARKRDASRKRKARTAQHGRMVALVHSSRHSSKKRGHEPSELDVDYLNELWDKQQGLCAYTNWPMNFETNSDDLVSIERIDNAIGYVRGNVVLICWCVNRARSDMPQQKFFDMCSAIASRTA